MDKQVPNTSKDPDLIDIDSITSLMLLGIVLSVVVLVVYMDFKAFIYPSKISFLATLHLPFDDISQAV